MKKEYQQVFNWLTFTTAIVLVCDVSKGLQAQELKAAVSSLQSQQSNNSSSLRTTAVSLQSSRLEALSTSTNTTSNYSLSATQVEQYSLTKLNVGTLTDKAIASDSKTSWMLSQHILASNFKSDSSTQRHPNELAQNLGETQDKSPSLSSSASTKQEFPVRLYIGPDFFYRNYGENIPEKPDFKSNEFGTLYGLQANLDYIKGNSVYFGLGFRYGGGQTKYDGGLQDTNGNIVSPRKSTTDNQFFNIEGRLGYTFRASRAKNSFLISPFVAVGYHQWNRDIAGGFEQLPNGQTTQVPEAKEDYSWGYVGPGIYTEYKVSRKFRIGLNAKLMFMFGGEIAFTSNQDRGNLGNDLQYEVELPLTYNIIESSKNAVDLKLTPYYRSQDIARGSLSVSGERFEPASDTSVWGATFGVQFRF